MRTFGPTGQWLLLAVLGAALCTPSMAGKKSPGQTKSPTGSPTKSPTQDPCGAAFKSTPPTCPNGHSVTAGTLVDTQTKEHGVCIVIQSVLCQCGSSGSGCPKAECKQFKPLVKQGYFTGFEVSADTLFASNFTGWTATQPTAQNMPKVIRSLKREYEIAIQTRAQKIDACATESIQAAKAHAATTTTLLTEECSKATGLQCCKAHGATSFGFRIPGSHQWEDTPTRCTLENPLVQSFYSNAGLWNVHLDRNEMARKPEEVTELKQHVHASLVAAFPGKQLALHAGGAAGSFWIVIGVGQRATTSRRLLGSFKDNSNLDGKAPGWHECEVKYQATVSIMKNANMPQCVKNIKGGELCEPEIAASLTPRMMQTKEEHENHANCVEEKEKEKEKDMQNLVRRRRGLSRCLGGDGQLFRPNNNQQTCAQVDTALRKGLATYRFGLKIRLAEKLTLGERI